MSEHPGVTFQEGPIGRRATLASGPDIWEIIRIVKATRAAEPALAEGELLRLVADNSGQSPRAVRTAVAYWADFPDEIEALLEHADRIETGAAAAAERTKTLFAR
jgi:hypothetical protein